MEAASETDGSDKGRGRGRERGRLSGGYELDIGSRLLCADLSTRSLQVCATSLPK
jgi:hypothetical protein